MLLYPEQIIAKKILTLHKLHHCQQINITYSGLAYSAFDLGSRSLNFSFLDKTPLLPCSLHPCLNIINTRQMNLGNNLTKMLEGRGGQGLVIDKQPILGEQ